MRKVSGGLQKDYNIEMLRKRYRHFQLTSYICCGYIYPVNGDSLLKK